MKKYILILFLSLINLCVIAQKVEICHIPPGNPLNAHTIFVDSNAVSAHLSHGDYLGTCDTSGIVIPNEPQFEIFVDPNPYLGFTTIQYTLPEDGYMLIGIYDIEANQIHIVVSANQLAGTYFYQFSAVDLGYSPGYYLLAYNFWATQMIYGTIVLIEL